MGAMAHAGAGDLFTVRTFCQFLILTALLLACGLAAFAAAVVPAKSRHQSVPVRFWTVVRSCSLTALILAPLQLLTTVASMAGTGLAQSLPLTADVLRETNLGKVWLVTMPLLIGLTAAAWWPGNSRRRAAPIALIAAALLVLHALVSHAIDFGAAAIVFYSIHEAAAALWGGALLGLTLTASGGFLDPPTARLIVVRTSRLAGWSVVLLAASGIYLAYCALGVNLDHLLYSAYGWTLLLKVSLFALLA